MSAFDSPAVEHVEQSTPEQTAGVESGVESGIESGVESPQPPQRNTLKWVIGAAVVLLLAWPVLRRLGSHPSGSVLESTVNNASSPAALIDLSLDHYRAGRFQECIDASQKALKMGAGDLAAEAYNNIGACAGSLGRYDDEIRNEVEALRLKPDLQVAKNNLAWALQQKRQQAK